jgi:hypothetical protein
VGWIGVKLEDVRKGVSVFMFNDRGVEKVSVSKVADGKASGKILAAKDFFFYGIRSDTP